MIGKQSKAILTFSAEKNPASPVDAGFDVFRRVCHIRHVRFYRLFAPQHFLYFLPDPQGQGSLRPTVDIIDSFRRYDGFILFFNT